MIIGNGTIKRVDAYDKVTGRAAYTGDCCPANALVAKVLHSTVANARVLAVDADEARKMPGVVAVFTCFDVPDFPFPTAGHPWTKDPARRDVADRLLLNRRVRYFGDDVAAVVAEDDVAAARALGAIRVEYDAYEPLLTPEAARRPSAPLLHEACPGNLLSHTTYGEGDADEALREPGLVHVGGQYRTQMVQHCHIENALSHAWMENGRVMVASSTQIPHIVRRVVGQALGIPWGDIRVIKPYVGGGFGNKQDVLYEPLNAWLAMQLGGRCVKLELTREETFFATRSRHAISFAIDAWFRPDGRLVARKVKAVSNQGGYASHGHAIVGNSISCFRNLYQDEKGLFCEADTVYTTLPAAGAMRGYGIPQAVFAIEAHMDDAARKLGLDPAAVRRKNMMRKGYVDPPTGITCRGEGLEASIAKGMELIGWEEKRARYANQSGTVRRGVGMAIFCYKTGLYPKLWEASTARLALNQDGSVQLMVGATEIGQGADTVFSQMAAETIGLTVDKVHILSCQDTDVTPFDPGAYASRQSYAAGAAIREAAALLRQKLLDHAAAMLLRSAQELDVRENAVLDAKSNAVLLPVEEVALDALYDIEHPCHITAECTTRTPDNAFSLGASFAEVEVDLALCRVNVLNIVNTHDCGTVLHPRLAEAQVHGGVGMALGYALSEQMLYDDSGRMLNDNLLDYKLPTAMDTPDIGVAFVGEADETGPYGNKSLGEPPAIPPAPAIRNAVLHATGLAFNALPITPQALFEKLYKAQATTE